MCRLGEATNPGPVNDAEAHGSGPLIGCINPTGLLGKSQLVSALPQGSQSIWAVSETHLTRPGRQKCRKELLFHGAKLNLQAGAPVAPKSLNVSAVGGKHKGVGFLTDTPARPMSQTWSTEAWNDGRFHIACFAINRRWIQGAVIYGHAANPDMTATRQATDLICQEATTRLVEQSTGLRFIAGDFNQEDGILESMRHWADQGWVNIQSWAFQKKGVAIRPTCKNKTTKDHVFVSPELALYLESVLVDDTYFKDHAILAARFACLGSPPKIPLWRTPKAIDWKEVPVIPENYEGDPSAFPHDDMSRVYAGILQQFEQEVNSTLRAHNKSPLLKKQMGRGQTREVHWVSEYSSPPKKGRPGDTTTGFHGIDPTHGRWLRQARRLVNLARLSQAQACSRTQQVHKEQLWLSIVHASGFHPNFPAWWNDQFSHLAALGHTCPGPVTAELVAKTFEQKLRELEKVLMKQKVADAKARRSQDPNVIFRDLQAEAQVPCQTLLLKRQAEVVEVSAEENALVVHPEHQWDESSMLQTPEGPLAIIHAEPDKLWVSSTTHEMVGKFVSQDKYLAEITDMFEEFRRECALRWDKHLETQDSFWDPIVQFTHSACPRPSPMEYSPITYDQWQASLKKKSKRAATGPDGLSRDDLLRMPKHLTLQLLKIFEAIETEGQEWPEQMVQAFVIALAKTNTAACVNDYRPISIFPVAYRNYSSIRARQVIAHMAALAPETCAGSVPNKAAHSIWYSILADLEMAHHTDCELSGAVIDLVKAFNLLPRIPILQIMRHLQVAPEILRGWSSALVATRRRFKLRNCVGPAVPSTTGYAEGCGLSVAAMLAVNIVAHRWMVCKHPTSQLWTYVDNIELTCPSATEAKLALDSLLQFTQVLDVQVDLAKTYVWSSKREGRRELRHDDEQEFQVLFKARDLGGHMTYTLQHTNGTLTKRLAKMPDLWNLLARSLASYNQKLRALTAKAWPLALHGVQAVNLGEHHYTSLRTGATRGLQVHTSGMNPMVHLSLIEHPKHDPQYHALLQTVVLMRSHGPPIEHFEFIMQQLHSPWQRRQPPPGPCHVLLTRLHQIGWSWTHGDSFLDHCGMPIFLFQCPIQEVKCRLRDGWQQRVLGLVQTRQTFEGAPYMSPQITVADIHKHPPEQQALLRTALNGSFFTADHAPHQNPQASDLCKFCNQRDSQKHRHWDCPFFDDCRKCLNAEQIEGLHTMPPIICNHGWVPMPPSHAKFVAQLLNTPDETISFNLPPSQNPYVHVFTDGSCMNPTSAMTRLASWGVVLGHPDEETFWPLSNGILPGYRQSTIRAEAVAAISACEYAILHRTYITLWVDNDLLYKRLKRFQHSQVRIASN